MFLSLSLLSLSFTHFSNKSIHDLVIITYWLFGLSLLISINCLIRIIGGQLYYMTIIYIYNYKNKTTIYISIKNLLKTN